MYVFVLISIKKSARAKANAPLLELAYSAFDPPFGGSYPDSEEVATSTAFVLSGSSGDLNMCANGSAASQSTVSVALEQRQLSSLALTRRRQRVELRMDLCTLDALPSSGECALWQSIRSPFSPFSTAFSSRSILGLAQPLPNRHHYCRSAAAAPAVWLELRVPPPLQRLPPSRRSTSFGLLLTLVDFVVTFRRTTNS